MGGPGSGFRAEPLPPEQTRSVKLDFRVFPAEAEQIARAAEANGLKVSDVCRLGAKLATERLLKSAPKVVQEGAPDG